MHVPPPPPPRVFAERSSLVAQIPLIYPSSLSSNRDSLEHFKTFLDDRMPRHRRGFYLWMIIAPLTAPFMIIRACHFSSLQSFILIFLAVIPNLPFFFCVWRSWSHYKGTEAWILVNSYMPEQHVFLKHTSQLGIYRICSHMVLYSQRQMKPSMPFGGNSRVLYRPGMLVVGVNLCWQAELSPRSRIYLISQRTLMQICVAR